MRKLFLLITFFSITQFVTAQEKSIAEKLVDEQLNGYNKRDIDAFLQPYSDSVELYAFPNTFLYKGKDIMRKEYAEMFTNTPNLYCTIKSRIVLGNKVVDEESVLFNKTKPPFRAVAIYVIENNKIAKVYFMQ